MSMSEENNTNKQPSALQAEMTELEHEQELVRIAAAPAVDVSTDGDVGGSGSASRMAAWKDKIPDISALKEKLPAMDQLKDKLPGVGQLKDKVKMPTWLRPTERISAPGETEEEISDTIISGILARREAAADAVQDTAALNRRIWLGLGIATVALLLAWLGGSVLLAAPGTWLATLAPGNLTAQYLQLKETVDRDIGELETSAKNIRDMQSSIDRIEQGVYNEDLLKIAAAKADMAAVYRQVQDVATATKKKVFRATDDNLEIKTLQITTPQDGVPVVSLDVEVRGLAFESGNQTIGESPAIAAIFADEMEKSKYFKGVEFKSVNKKVTPDAALATSTTLKIDAQLQPDGEINAKDDTASGVGYAGMAAQPRPLAEPVLPDAPAVAVPAPRPAPRPSTPTVDAAASAVTPASAIQDTVTTSPAANEATVTQPIESTTDASVPAATPAPRTRPQPSATAQ